MKKIRFVGLNEDIHLNALWTWKMLAIFKESNGGAIEVPFLCNETIPTRHVTRLDLFFGWRVCSQAEIDAAIAKLKTEFQGPDYEP